MEQYLTIKHASTALGLKVRTVREWVKTGKIRAIKYPNCPMWFIPESEIDRLTKGSDKDGNKD